MEQQTPKQSGFKMPAEWHPHAATWLSWPTCPVNWPGKNLEKTRDTYLHIIEALHCDEQVNILADDEQTKTAIFDKLKKSGISEKNVSVHIIPTGDIWIRDYGPTYLLDKQQTLGAVNWQYNAWGNKYPDLLADDKVPEQMADIVPCRYFDPGIVLEGGSIDTNGNGLCLTTKQCLLNPNRNPHLSAAQIEQKLADYIGTDTVLWLEGGIEGDDTDGHVDDIARFVDEKTVLMTVEKNITDPNAAVLLENLSMLTSQSERLGLGLEIIQVPMPEPVVNDKNQRVPASYMNFYIANKTILLPVFKQTSDSYAISVLKERFPKHTVVPIDCTTLVWGLGAIHCGSQQQPLAKETT